jgi:gamma-glutamylcyclotransferase (GGCT)/AIG2-like uncharacterized protein YtfP
MPLLFSYGTLQLEEVQRATFGRLLKGERDELVGFEEHLIRIKDTKVVEMSGKEMHKIVRFNGRSESRVKGMVFEISEAELEKADQYETKDYVRISTKLASGKEGWVYAEAGTHIGDLADSQAQPQI